MKTIKIKSVTLLSIIILVFISLTSVSALEDNSTDDAQLGALQADDETPKLKESSSDLEERIINADNDEEILINPGEYYINDLKITKNITLQGNGHPLDIIINGNHKSSIFLIRDDAVHVTFRNITFINANTPEYGGAISMEMGHVNVDNCYFINNTAGVNAGAISNYGNDTYRGQLLVNNSFFMNNHGGHDGGAVTTCYADSYIYNSVFINNSAHRDGGAIRVSVSGFGNVEDCIFMFNHADEWGGAYYSWSGESDIKRCIFMNNTAGTNGGAVMISGNINLQDSIIVNNNGGETGGSFYIQQPMYDAKTVMNIHNNIITNNSSPKGQEIFIKWQDIKSLYTKFDDNDWGDEDPNDPSVIDPDKVTSRSKVSRTIKSDLFTRLNVDLLDKYMDLLGDFFTDDSYNNLKDQFKHDNEANHEKTNPTSNSKNNKIDQKAINKNNINDNNTSDNLNTKTESNSQAVTNNNQIAIGNSTSHGDDSKAYELNETGSSVAKQIITSNLKYIAVIIVIVLILLAFGYKRYEKKSK